jgi:uncharacterized protein
MRTIVRTCLLLVLLLLVLVATPAAAAATAGAPAPAERAAPAVAGDWLGALAVGAVELRLALHVEQTEDGGLHAMLDSIDQGAKIPVERIGVEGSDVTLALPAIGAAFAGRLDAAGSTIEGTWTQGGRELPLTFSRTAEPTVLNRPQEPRPPFPYAAEEVTFRNEAAGLRLAGTLLVPPGEGPFPAVLFVSGSGPQDRDEQVMGHRPFLVLADHLARRGIASLRYDDRGAGASEGDHMGSTVTEFAADAAAALAFLAARPEVDRRAVGILGHSEGGVTGPRVAAASGGVDFLVLLAPPAVPIDRLLLRQGDDILRLGGAGEELIERAAMNRRAYLDLVRDEELDDEELAATLRERAATAVAAYSPEERAALGLDDAAVDQSIAMATTAWFRSILREDPAVWLRRIDVPVLALFGGKDVQVAADDNAAALRTALAAGGNDEVEIEVYPGLNHLFQHADTGAIDEYGKIEETMAPEVLERIGGWIAARFGELPGRPSAR